MDHSHLGDEELMTFMAGRRGETLEALCTGRVYFMADRSR
jgi:hypothetical protein